jgi:hypothetical protein
VHGPPQCPCPFAVYNANLQNITFPTFLDIIRHKVFYFTRRKGVQIQDPIYGKFYCLVMHGTLRLFRELRHAVTAVSDLSGDYISLHATFSCTSVTAAADEFLLFSPRRPMLTLTQIYQANANLPTFQHFDVSALRLVWHNSYVISKPTLIPHI